MENTNTATRLLVGIASYGKENDKYLAQLVKEYSAMSLTVDIVVLSNIEKTVEPGVELIIGLPDRDPWSLPFAHKQIFADRLADYDLFLYSEDDVLITERSIRAFLKAVRFLSEDEIPGFLRFEEGPGEKNYPDFHGHFHWDTKSVRSTGDYTTCFFTNEHSGCYLLTRAQLQRAIDSGGYLVEPHKAKHDLLCSAATDPYTQCGLQKVICISHINDFLVHHLPNKYVGSKFGIRQKEFCRQIHALLTLPEESSERGSLFVTETKLMGGWFSKDYYEPKREELESIIPPHVKTILSVGCGWGATETWLAEKGYQVSALPLDPVIAGNAADKGVELVYGDFPAALRKLANRRFDCLLLLNVLHLVEDPAALISSFNKLLIDSSVIVSVDPNMLRESLWGKKRREQKFFGVSYQTAGTHFVSHKVVREWFHAARAKVKNTVEVLDPSSQTLSKLTFGMADSFLSSEFFCIAKKEVEKA